VLLEKALINSVTRLFQHRKQRIEKKALSAPLTVLVFHSLALKGSFFFYFCLLLLACLSLFLEDYDEGLSVPLSFLILHHSSSRIKEKEGKEKENNKILLENKKKTANTPKGIKTTKEEPPQGKGRRRYVFFVVVDGVCVCVFVKGQRCNGRRS
jgi:hypothetical protein